MIQLDSSDNFKQGSELINVVTCQGAGVLIAHRLHWERLGVGGNIMCVQVYGTSAMRNYEAILGRKLL